MNRIMLFEKFSRALQYEPTDEEYDDLIEQYYYHNTSKSNVQKIRGEGWNVGVTNRKKLYGNGVYFTKGEPNTRWGSEHIKVKVEPKKVLYDPDGDLRYEDNPLGQEILDRCGLRYAEENYELWLDALNEFIKENKYDCMFTTEFGKEILVVFDTSIINDDI